MNLSDRPAADAATRVHLDIDEGRLYARIEPGAADAGASVAFYLLHDGRKVEATPYGTAHSVGFRTPPGEGRFRAQAFVRAAGDAATQMLSSRTLQRGSAAQRHRVLDDLAVHRVGLDGVAAALRSGTPCRLQIDTEPFGFECAVGARRGDALFVILGGATPPRDDITLPRFSRFSWGADFPGTLLCVQDPTLHLDPDIRLGWYFGDADRDAIAGLSRVVQTCADALGIAREHIVCYGSSGGGFAALQLALRLGEGATAIAINPQTAILAFAKRDSVEEFRAVCLGGLDDTEAMRRFGPRLSARQSWAQGGADARCLLVQNRSDGHHLREHFRPFLRQFGVVGEGRSAQGHIGAMIYDFPNGHGAEPRSLVPQILQRAGALHRPAPSTSTSTPAMTTPTPTPSPADLEARRERIARRAARLAASTATPAAAPHVVRQAAPEAPTSALLARIAAIKPRQDLLSHTYISLRHRYMYAAVGKAANSTVKHHLYELEYSGTRFTTKSLHDRQSSPLLSPFQLPDDLLEAVLTGGDYLRFSVVRNPYTRILSCYLDRIVPAGSLPYRQVIAALGRQPGEALSFEDFVRAICKQRPFEQNNHWRLQVSEICRDVIRYDEIGKQESFAEDMTRIWTRIAKGRPVPDFAAENKAPSITSAERRIAEFYTPALIDLVRNAYRADFEAFGYPLDPQ